MSDEWEDLGETRTSALGGLLLGPLSGGNASFHTVRHIETGEEREIRVEPDQEVGEAIEEGQWSD